MGWLRDRFGRSSGGPTDSAERLTTRGLVKTARESAALGDRETVRRWVHELHPERDQQILVHRPWGTVAAVADGRHPVTVLRSDGDDSWFAVVPGAADDRSLTPEQVEHVLLDALTASGPPDWPEWRRLT
jgi:hypothetical protein